MHNLTIPNYALDIAINLNNYEMVNYFLDIGLRVTKQTVRFAKKYPDILKLLCQKRSSIQFLM